MSDAGSTATAVPKYHIDLFWSDEDNCWIANVPDLRFCSASGHSPSEAAAEIEIAMSLWMESWLDDHDTPPAAAYRPLPSREFG